MWLSRVALPCVLLTCGVLAAACGDDSASGSGAGGAGASGPSSGAGLASVDPGSPNTPESGCIEGFTACGEVCVDLTNDYRHCGGCDVSCEPTAEGQSARECVSSACVQAPCETIDCFCAGATCDGACTYGLDGDADNCGACANQCAADEICFEGRCGSGGGRGTSCADPIFWNVDAQEEAGFRWSDGLTSDHVFVCGPLDPVPTRWFRVTVPDEKLHLEVRGAPGDDYIVEVFRDDACTDDVSIACADGEPGDDIDLEAIETTPGTTFWVAVGLQGDWSGVAAGLRVDT